MASEAPTFNQAKSMPASAAAASPAAPSAPAPARRHLMLPGSAMAAMAARAEAMRPGPWYSAWEQAILQPSLETFEGLAANPGAGAVRAVRWMLFGAAVGWGLPAMAILLRTTVPLFTVIFAYLGMVALTLAVFGAATAAAHALAERLGARGSFGGLAFACAAFAAPLTLLAGMLVSGPSPLRLLLLPAAIYALVLTVLAARAAYDLDWRRAAVTTLPAAALLALLPLAAVAGVWAGLAGW